MVNGLLSCCLCCLYLLWPGIVAFVLGYKFMLINFSLNGFIRLEYYLLTPIIYFNLWHDRVNYRFLMTTTVRSSTDHILLLFSIKCDLNASRDLIYQPIRLHFRFAGSRFADYKYSTRPAPGNRTIQHPDYSAPLTIQHQGVQFGHWTIQPLDYSAPGLFCTWAIHCWKKKLSDVNHVLVCVILCT